MACRPVVQTGSIHIISMPRQHMISDVRKYSGETPASSVAGHHEDGRNLLHSRGPHSLSRKMEERTVAWEAIVIPTVMALASKLRCSLLSAHQRPRAVVLGRRGYQEPGP